MAVEGQTLLPGDWVAVPQSCRLGPGIYNDPSDCGESGEDSDVRACMAGLLRKRETSRAVGGGRSGEGGGGGPTLKMAWIDYSSKRYVPMKGDRVLGVITKTTGRSYRVDIGSAMPASLPELAFEGATKRNKPNLQVGEIVYARVSRSHKDMEPELSCVDGSSGKSTGLGQLPVQGNVLHCSIGLCRKLLSSPCAVIEALGKYFKFELTVGMNGRVWVNSGSVVQVIAITNAIERSEGMTEEQCRHMVDTIAERR